MSDKIIINIDSLKYYNDKINQTKQDTLISGTNIKTINGESIIGSGNIEIIGGNPDANIMAVDTGDVLDDVNVEYATKEELAQKQDVISDIATIRSGAAKGATALQSVPSEYVTETELSNKGYATISALNNKVDAINGKQLSTEDFTTALKTKLEGLNNYDDTELSNAIETLRGDFDNIVSGDTTTAIKTFNEVIAFLDGLTDTQDLESIIASIEQQIAGKMDKVTLATVATSGNYNDLSNKPTIPSAVTESTVSDWGFTKNTGTYSKPSDGIPKSDLASAVQTSLGKADTALQSYTEQYQGTVTGVKINGTTKNPSSGVVDLGTVITAHQTLKTINGESIVGSGDIESLASKEYVDEKSDSKVFIGTLAEYQEAYAAGKIAVGALVIIMEEGEDANDTIALLGTAVLGKMILGQK